MKKIILLRAVFFCCGQFLILFTGAQTLYGTTFFGGNSGGGTINNYMPATNNLGVAKSFERGFPAVYPGNASFIQASDGKLYGMTIRGGINDNGAIFSFDPGSSTYTQVFDFAFVSGSNPYGSLLQARNGKLYGMTYEGGKGRSGVIFAYDPFVATYTKLLDFDGTNGASPTGSLIQASDGKLYGMTIRGGTSGYGVIFSYDPASSTYRKLKDFDGTNGSGPCGALVQANNGKLYGITSEGGSSGRGVIFSYDISSSIYTNLKDFNGTIGSLPSGSLIQAKDGKLYGMAGAIFSFDPNSSTFSKLMDFDCDKGCGTPGSLIQAKDGKLYGMTTAGGTANVGVIFSFEPLSSTFLKIQDFDVTNGASPYGSLLQASDGQLYGMTSYGGSVDNISSGVIFSFDPASLTYKKRKEFGNNQGGSNVSSHLLLANDGKLYATTINGGNNNAGVIFSFDPGNYNFSKLKDFEVSDGANPHGALIQAEDGKLYGMTSNGGGDYGVIFSFDPVSSGYAKLSSFSGSNGAHPFGSLCLASDGKLYGMTSEGISGYDPEVSNTGYGVLFSFDPVSSNSTKLMEFNDTCGAYPHGSLIQAGDGKLYGMTRYGGGSGKGVIFSFDPLLSTYTKLVDFDGSNGGMPEGSLIQAIDGKLYGITAIGGKNNYGVIFSFDPLTATYTRLIDLDSSNGCNPLGSLMQASDGKLYGMTNKGGSKNSGVIFSFDPSSGIYSKLQDYIGSNGANPGIGAAFIQVRGSIINTAPKISLTTPTDNATYLAGGNVYIKAIASDADGTISKVEFYNDTTLLFTTTDTPYAFKWEHLLQGNYILFAKATDNNGIVTTSDTFHISVVPNKSPTVSIISPANGKTFLKGATVHLQAAALDADGRIGKVEFYVGATLLSTEHKLPYTFDYILGETGNYTFTAKATDNWGAITTCAPVNVFVVPNQHPTVNIISPSGGQTFVAPATIKIEAAAQDPDGRIVQVSFYNGASLLTNSEHKVPYTYQWQNVPAGTYTIAARAKDNWSAESTSAPVTISVMSPGTPVASALSSSSAIKAGIKETTGLQLAPNPANDILNIYSTGFQSNKQTTISLLSVAGEVIDKIPFKNPIQSIQLDVSSLSSGVYIIKIINGNKIIYGKFVKL